MMMELEWRRLQIVDRTADVVGKMLVRSIQMMYEEIGRMLEVYMKVVASLLESIKMKDVV